MRDAEAAVVWDAHLGGWPTTVIGIESHPIDRFGPVPADGPSQWTSGTLFPKSSKKVARAINANGGRRPLVVLANLPASTARPSRCASGSSSTAPRSAARSSTSAARSSSA
jgi:hypothetical protein